MLTSTTRRFLFCIGVTWLACMRSIIESLGWVVDRTSIHRLIAVMDIGLASTLFYTSLLDSRLFYSQYQNITPSIYIHVHVSPFAILFCWTFDTQARKVGRKGGGAVGRLNVLGVQYFITLKHCPSFTITHCQFNVFSADYSICLETWIPSSRCLRECVSVCVNGIVGVW